MNSKQNKTWFGNSEANSVLGFFFRAAGSLLYLETVNGQRGRREEVWIALNPAMEEFGVCFYCNVRRRKS